MNQMIRMIGLAAAVLASGAALAAKPVKPGLTQEWGMPVFAAGQQIGWAVDFAFSDSNTSLLSEKAYFFRMNKRNGALLSYTWFFVGPDCTGDAYHEALEPWQYAQGYVFAGPANMMNRAYYVPKGSSPTTRMVSSFMLDRGLGPECTNQDFLDPMPVSVGIPNDPAVTGVDNGPFALPITIGLP